MVSCSVLSLTHRASLIARVVDGVVVSHETIEMANIAKHIDNFDFTFFL